MTHPKATCIFQKINNSKMDLFHLRLTYLTNALTRFIHEDKFENFHFIRTFLSVERTQPFSLTDFM